MTFVTFLFACFIVGFFIPVFLFIRYKREIFAKIWNYNLSEVLTIGIASLIISLCFLSVGEHISRHNLNMFAMSDYNFIDLNETDVKDIGKYLIKGISVEVNTNSGKTYMNLADGVIIKSSVIKDLGKNVSVEYHIFHAKGNQYTEDTKDISLNKKEYMIVTRKIFDIYIERSHELDKEKEKQDET